MNYGLLFRTVRHLKPTQVLYQAKYRLKKPAYKLYDSSRFNIQISGLKTQPIAKYSCSNGNRFSFLNLEHEFAGWNFDDYGMLWAYNQNYFDWINQEGVFETEACCWIDRFIKELSNNKVGLDPYPIALRSINWVKFFCLHPNSATEARRDSLYSQIKLLEKKLEYHLLGNHLLEDAYALYIGASYFKDAKLLNKARKLLVSQLKEQVLPDGAHYEQSPMYHCILLDRLLDCININTSPELEQNASMMLGHLESIVWSDGSIPLLNDSALGIAPEPKLIFEYAQRLGLEWKTVSMKECGYRKLTQGGLEAILDVGNITATYQPGHTHADSLNYELRIHGKPFVIDTGISTYNKTERRQLERSTIAHNCISVESRNSTEVWGGFRVGGRAKVCMLDESHTYVEAKHNGFGKECKRRFEMADESFVVEDWYDGEAVSYLHLAEKADLERINVEGASKIEIEDCLYSKEYNTYITGKVMKLHFAGSLKYTIQ